MLAPWAARAQTIDYELYELRSNSAPILLSSGTRTYTAKDIVIQEHRLRGRFLDKGLQIYGGFSAGVSDFRDTTYGFGMWLKDRDSFWAPISGGGFSWDWFYPERGNDFRKLQGTGLVRVSYSSESAYKEIGSIEVLQDITLRVDTRPWFFFVFGKTTWGETHRMVVKKGSAFSFNGAGTMKPRSDLSPFILIALLVWVIGDIGFFRFSKNIELKKRLRTASAIGTGSMFILFFLVLSDQPRILLFVTPLVALSTYRGLRHTAICNACGRKIFVSGWFSKRTHCRFCSAKISN